MLNPITSEHVKNQQAVAKKKNEPNVPLFVLVLYEICSADNLQHAIHWVDDGQAFRIESREVFEEQVLPNFYKHSNFNSFQRQLNMYNFHKKTRSINEIVFYHEHFRKDNPQSLIKIVRKSNPASESHAANKESS